MSLKLDRVCAGVRNSVNESMSQPKTAIMRLSDFANQKTVARIRAFLIYADVSKRRHFKGCHRVYLSN
jgi:hypothetical protein